MTPIPYSEQAREESGQEVFNICNLTQLSHQFVLIGIQRLIVDVENQLVELRKLTVRDVFHSGNNADQIAEKIDVSEKQKEYLSKLLINIFYNHGL